jgi:hypothetical protein
LQLHQLNKNEFLEKDRKDSRNHHRSYIKNKSAWLRISNLILTNVKYVWCIRNIFSRNNIYFSFNRGIKNLIFRIALFE